MRATSVGRGDEGEEMRTEMAALVPAARNLGRSHYQNVRDARRRPRGVRASTCCIVLVLAGSFAADPAAAATAGGCYVWQGQVTINLQDQYWIALRSNPRVTGPGSPVLFAHVQDNCYATARFGANGRVQWIPSAYSVGVNSGVYSGPSRSAVSAQVYGTRWVAAKHVYTRAAQPLFQMAVAP